MNLIFVTQTSSAKLFWHLLEHIRTIEIIEQVGFHVAGHFYYLQFLQQYPEIESGVVNLLKEWEIIQKAEAVQVDPDLITSYERELGDSTLWNALVADRRIVHGKKCIFQQDYKARFTHESMLKILQNGLVCIDAFIEKIKPDAIIGLNAVTFCDYLFYLFAKARSIAYFQLKLTRIENYVSLYTQPFKLSQHLSETYLKYFNGREEDKYFKDARKFLEQMRTKRLAYEGAIQLKPDSKKNRFSLQKKSLAFRNLLQYERSPASGDNHIPSPWQGYYHNNIVKPARHCLVHRRMKKSYVHPEMLKSLDYAFYPMHTEPEVALSVFGRQFRNQIETIRNIAISIPVNWKLIVKAHPNSKGYHSYRYYTKILEIPNVLLVSVDVGSDVILENAGLVVVVNGTIGLEAVIRRKPLIVLGHSPYDVFPESMVGRVNDLNDLSDNIAGLINTYQFHEKALLAYIAAHIRGSVRANLFTELLKKGGRTTMEGDLSIDEQYANLAKYTVERVKQEESRK